MKIFFVLQVLYGWPGSGEMTNAGFPNPIVYDSYLECKVDADKLNVEADKIPSVDTFGGKFYFMCRPSVSR